MYPREGSCLVIIMVTASHICSLGRRLRGLPALSALPGRQESCTVPSAHGWLALRCSSRVQSSSCVLDYRHENSLHVSERRHLNKTRWLWCCTAYPGMLFLRFTAFKMHYICCWDGVGKKKKDMRKSSFSMQTPWLHLLSFHFFPTTWAKSKLRAARTTKAIVVHRSCL